jgi:hypothetical protein
MTCKRTRWICTYIDIHTVLYIYMYLKEDMYVEYTGTYTYFLHIQTAQLRRFTNRQKLKLGPLRTG